MLTAEGLDWLSRAAPFARGVAIPSPVIFPLPLFDPIISVERHVREERKLLLAVGRLEPQKGFDFLIAAFSRLAVTHGDWDLVILGEGEGQIRLQCIIDRMGLRDRVWLLGRCGNVGDWYERADLYVMSSLFEGFPNTLTEAMAHGCAAVSYDCDTGPRDIIRHGTDGLLVRPVGDESALAISLGSLMGNDAFRQEMGRRAISVRDRFSLERVLGMWRSIIKNNETTRG